MARRDVRRMLMERKKSDSDHHRWLIPLVLVGVLAAGLGIGWGLGQLGKPAKVAVAPAPVVEQPAALDRPPRREAATASQPMGDEDESLPPPHAPAPPRPGADPEPEVAAVPLILPQPSVRPTAFNAPAWTRFAVPAPQTTGQPVIAVIIDDLGVDKRRSERVVALRSPLTLAWMTYAEDLPRQAAQGRGRGHELMVHMPMQPLDGHYDPGPDVLEVGLSPEELRRRIDWGLSRFDGFIGVNNHMGSRFTGDKNGMRVVMEEMRRRGLAFVDSVTTDKSVAPELARRYGVPFAVRHIFLDNDQDIGAVRTQLAKVEAHARKHGHAIAIGHPHDATIEALSTWLPGLEGRGFVLVPVSAIIKTFTPGG
jgi:polysaccharide deacetylase 2 family uncharacterized protein YibQ